jgi:uncharacterized protein
MTLKRITNVLRKNHEKIKDQFRVKKIGIFGSYVRGEQGPKSDVDILVSFSRSPGYFGFLELEEFLSHLLDAKVDLVTPEALRPTIGKRILKEVVYL